VCDRFPQTLAEKFGSAPTALDARTRDPAEFTTQ
jgi:hypothetical protein